MPSDVQVRMNTRGGAEEVDRRAQQSRFEAPVVETWRKEDVPDRRGRLLELVEQDDRERVARTALMNDAAARSLHESESRRSRLSASGIAHVQRISRGPSRTCIRRASWRSRLAGAGWADEQEQPRAGASGRQDPPDERDRSRGESPLGLDDARAARNFAHGVRSVGRGARRGRARARRARRGPGADGVDGSSDPSRPASGHLLGRGADQRSTSEPGAAYARAGS